MKWLTAFIVAFAFVNAPAIASAQSGKPAPSEAAQLKTGKAAYSAAKAAYLKAPKNAKLKKAYVFQTVKYGMQTMYAVELPPRMKYPAALALFKEALKLDPKNPDALAEKEKIDSVYRMMRKKG